MKIQCAFRVRLYPTKTQEIQLSATIDGARFVYNHFLEARKNHYLESKKTLSYLAMSKELTVLRKAEPALSGIQYTPLQQSLRRLDTAYNSFFRKQNRFPKFKSRYAPHQSFERVVDWRVVGNGIQVQKDLVVKFRGFIDPTADLGTLVVSKHSTGKWFASITAKIEKEPSKVLGESFGIDVGVETLATLSTGEKYKNIRPQQTLQKKLTALQKKFARAQKGSKRREKLKISLARLHERIYNTRQNHLHKVSREIVAKNPTLIAVEDLNVKGMMGNSKYARGIADASMRELLRQVEYKQAWNGGTTEKIDRYFPSSKTCSGCSFVMDSLPLSVRNWKCPKCGVEHDRDVNAAKNILKQASAHEARGGKGKTGAIRELPLSTKRGYAKA